MTQFIQINNAILIEARLSFWSLQLDETFRETQHCPYCGLH